MGRQVGRWMVYALLSAGAALMLVPFLWLVRSALMEKAAIFAFPPVWLPSPPQWRNFPEALSVLPFGRYLLNTLILEVLVVTGTVASASLCGYAFARLRWRGRSFWFAAILSTTMLPYAVTLIPTFMMWKYVRALDSFFPLFLPAWFGGGATNIFLMRQFFLTLPRELEEAAIVDGASYPVIYARVLLPLAKPALAVTAFFTFLGVWNDFLGPLLYLNDERLFTLSLGLAQFQGEYSGEWHYLMAASCVLVFPVIAAFALCQRTFLQGIALTGLKG
jgi:multiple sugar transport system permease protein